MTNFKKEGVLYFLNRDLAELSEDTPLSEEDPLEMFEYEAEDEEFSLSDSCTERFAEDLEALDRVELARVCNALSL